MSQARFASPLQPRASARRDAALQRRDRRQHDRVEHKQRSETPITVGMGRDQLLAASARRPPGPQLAHPPTSPRSASRPQAASAEPPRHVLRGKSATGADGEWWTSWQTKLAPAERSGPPALAAPSPSQHTCAQPPRVASWEAATAILVARDERTPRATAQARSFAAAFAFEAKTSR